MDDLFEAMSASGDYPAAASDVGDVLKKVGLISVGSIGGALIRDKGISKLIADPLWSTVTEAGVGVLGAAFALNSRSDLLFWPLVGVGVHGVTDLLRQVLGTAGVLPAA